LYSQIKITFHAYGQQTAQDLILGFKKVIFKTMLLYLFYSCDKEQMNHCQVKMKIISRETTTAAATQQQQQ
jgi:hypothetical protein